ncbi:MAG: hypothetical protein ACFCU1_03415 [Sumerlaeia bacterium]
MQSLVLRVGFAAAVWVLVSVILLNTVRSIRAENQLRQGRYLAENSPTSNKRLQFITNALELDPSSLEARHDLARFVDNQTKQRFQNNQYNLIKEDDLLKAYNNLDLLIDSYPYQPRILRQKADLANILSLFYMQRGEQEKADSYNEAYFEFNMKAYRQLPQPLNTPQKFNLDVLISANNTRQFAAAAEVLGYTALIPERSIHHYPQTKQVALNAWLNLSLVPLVYDELFTQMQSEQDQLPLIQRYLFTLDQDPYNRPFTLDLLERLKAENKLFEHGQVYLTNLRTPKSKVLENTEKPTVEDEELKQDSSPSAPLLIINQEENP